MARVLVVDDEEVVRSLLHLILEPAGHQAEIPHPRPGSAANLP
jgi:CheY-like chemotaxis protein